MVQEGLVRSTDLNIDGWDGYYVQVVIEEAYRQFLPWTTISIASTVSPPDHSFRRRVCSVDEYLGD